MNIEINKYLVEKELVEEIIGNLL